MSNGMNGRVGGLFQRLLSDEPGPFDEQINRDVEVVFSDHSAFYRKGSPGQADLRTLLRAYVIFAPSGYRTDIARLAGAMLIHAVLEDAFWLLAGLFNRVLKSYYVLDTKAFIIDLNVFGGILEGSEPRIGQLFRSAGVLRTFRAAFLNYSTDSAQLSITLSSGGAACSSDPSRGRRSYVLSTLSSPRARDSS